MASGLDRPEGIAAADGKLLVAEAGTGRLLAVDLATGEMSTLAEGLEFSPGAPEGGPPTFVMNSMAVDPAGVIYVTGDRANVLYRIEPVE